MPKKSFTIGIRVDEAFYKRLQKTFQLTGVEPGSFGRSGLEAIVTYVEKHGHIVLPLAVMPIPEYEWLSELKKRMEAPKE